jgi:hypothetical protein
MPEAADNRNTAATLLLEHPVAIDHLTLPNYVEPPPRIPVVARYCGPVMAAMRRAGGYRFESPTERTFPGPGWIARVLPRRG